MINTCLEKLRSPEFLVSLKKIYPSDFKAQAQRFKNLVKGFAVQFDNPTAKLRLFSSPGRTEIGGNHTDHQHGRVLAAAVSMDNIAAASITGDNLITIFSEGYGITKVDTADTAVKPEEKNTTAAVVRGITARFLQLGYKVGGLNAYISSTVPAGSGLSSSASFENLVSTMLSALFNDSKIDPVTIAQIGQFAENEYFGKPSGLMDQAASSIGGIITIDFKDPQAPKVEPVAFDLADYGFCLCIVNTHSDHADLTDDYAEIFNESKLVAEHFNKQVLREVAQEDFYAAIPELRKKINDRAVLRAMHFFGENDRVTEQVTAIRHNDFEGFKKLVIQSGESSFNRLQNIYSTKTPLSQPLALALEYSRKLLEPVGGAWRIHGGGFAGTIQAFVPTNFAGDYKAKMDAVFGDDSTQILEIRKTGNTEVL